MKRAGMALAVLVAASVAGLAQAQAPTEAQLTAFLGTRKQGFAPVCVAQLKRDMTPAEAAAVMPGADKPSPYGIVALPPPATAKEIGIEKIEVHYLDDDKKQRRLYSVDFHFDAEAAADAALYDALVKALVAKYGPAPKEAVDKKLITWIGRNSAMAQLQGTIYGGNSALHLDITLEAKPY